MTSDMESDVSNPSDAKRLWATEGEFGDYDVFISHRGPDTKTGFVGYLHDALKRVGLHPFLDCMSIGKGQDSWKCIDQAIKITPLALVIFSKSFAQSEWCLKELHAMLESPSMKVLPIFYKVQPWEVSFPNKGQLAIGFTKLAERHDECLLDEWRIDMKMASKLNGWEHKKGDKRLEKDLVLEVVGKIFELANKPLPLDVGDHIVGVKQVAKNLIQTVNEKNFLMLGLWGMGGIGKSTLARELYNQLEQRFDAKCYVEDVVEKVNQGGVTSVQNLILKPPCENDKITNKSNGKVILEERLSKKSILLVLDDVRDNDDMDYLVSHKMLKKDSLCIVTSRNRRIFEKSTSFHVNHEIHTYEVQLLNDRNSQSVLACHAFGGDCEVPPRFKGLVRDVSMACNGVPLVLKVCGSLLRHEEDVETWEEVLKKLCCGTIMDEKKIFECLRISYDALQEQHQEMFLDIACALLGESAEMAKLVWRSQGWSATLGVRSLVEKALIKVDASGALGMHDHLRDMGRAIAKQESASMGIYKRLWGFESLAFLNKNELLPGSLQTLILPRELKIRINLSVMKELRIFKCEGGLFSMSLLLETLRWLHNIELIHSPLTHFPESPENNELVILFWTYGSIERLPESFGVLNKLKVLNLRYCVNLMELPDSFGGLMNLENLDLQGSGIQNLPKSFGTLNKLKMLNLRYCNGFKELPDSFGSLKSLENLDLESSGIQSLSKSFGMLSKLKVLNLGDCCELVELPNSFGGLQNLKNLDLETSGIQSLPESFGMLSNLEVLNLQTSYRFLKLPDSFGGLQNLKNLDLETIGIQNLSKSFGMLSNLEVSNPKSCSTEVQVDSKASSSIVLNEDDDYFSKDFKVSCHITKWIIYRDLIERTLLCFFNREEMEYEFYFEDHESMATIIGLGVPHSKVVLECGSPHVTVVEIPKENWDVIWAHADGIPHSIPEDCILKQERFPNILHHIANIINIDNIVSKTNNNGVEGDNGKGKIEGNSDDRKGKGKAHYRGNDGHPNRGSNGPNDDDKEERKGKDGNDEKKDNRDRGDGKTSNDGKEVQAVVHLLLLRGGILEEKGKRKEIREVHEEEVEEMEKKLGEVHVEEVEGGKKELGEGCKGVEKKKKKYLRALRNAFKRGESSNVVENQQKSTTIEELQDGDVDESLQKQLNE